MGRDLGDLVWEAPPPAERRRYDWPEISRQLRNNPGKWMRIFENGPTSTANAIRQGDVASLRSEDGFEVTTRNNTRSAPRRCSLYLRWVDPERQSDASADHD
jgi:hypothetical protein